MTQTEEVNEKTGEKLVAKETSPLPALNVSAF